MDSSEISKPRRAIRPSRTCLLSKAQNLAPLVIVLLLSSVFCSFGQTTNGRITGTVQDSTGAVIPGAAVSVLNIRTDARAQGTTDPSGAFIFTALPPGLYSLTVDAPGFRKAVVTNIELNVGATIAQAIRLEVGATTESVQVEANAVAVQTTEAQVSNTVTMKEIDSLPQLARAPIALVYYQAGIAVNAGDQSFSRVNGLRIGSNNSKLDGIDVNDSVVPRLGLAMTATNTDSVGEFRVVSSGKAEYGRNAGGQIELITRSGTNEFHGNAFEYLRNTDLNANDFFNNMNGNSRPKFIQNMFGGSFGGRIIRDKLFVFGNYQGRRTAQDTIRNRTVYTPEAKTGIFRWKNSGGTESFNILQADPLGKGIDPAMARIFSKVPSPNNNDVGDGLNTAGFRFNNPSGSMEDQYTIKGDYQVSSVNRAFLRWSWQRNSSIDALNNADATYPGMPQGEQGGHRWGFAVGDDWTISPTMVNEFRIGYQRANSDFLRPNRLQGLSVVTNLMSPDLDYPNFAQGRWSPVIDITENLTLLHNKHVFKMGANIRRTLQHGYNDAGIYPTVYTDTGNGNTVASSIGPAIGSAGLTSANRTVFEQLYNDVLGRVSYVTQTFYSDLTKFQGPGLPRVRDFLLRDGGFFFQDDWRVSRNLTLNLGLRWEYFMPPKEENGFQGVFDQANLMNGITPLTNLTINKSSEWFGMDRNNFAPRFGFAYDLRRGRQNRHPRQLRHLL